MTQTVPYVLNYARPTTEVDAPTPHDPRGHRSVESPPTGKRGGIPGQPRSADRRCSEPMGELKAGLVVLGRRDFPRGGR